MLPGSSKTASRNSTTVPARQRQVKLSSREFTTYVYEASLRIKRYHDDFRKKKYIRYLTLDRVILYVFRNQNIFFGYNVKLEEIFKPSLILLVLKILKQE